MSKGIKAAFEFEGVMVALDKLLPTKKVPDKVKETVPFKTIVASARELGLIEPVSVYPQKGGKFLLLDGHLRVEALRELGVEKAPCLISTDDETYTYNNKVNRVAPIQATRMILKALDAGVSEDRIAKALNRTVNTVRRNRTRLEGICPEAIDLLKDKLVPQGTLALFKKVKPIRQIEMAEHMNTASTYTVSYARAIVMTTDKDLLVEPESPKKIPGVKPEDLARLEHEMRTLEKDMRLLDETYSDNVMNLTIARGYLRKILEKSRVVKYLSQKHREVLAEFQHIVESTALDA